MRSATASARADLPLAVGPAISTASRLTDAKPLNDTKEIARFEARAEEACSAMYDVRDPNVKDCYEDASYNLARAIDIARMRGLAGEVERLTARRDHIAAVYNSRLRRRS